MFGWANGIGSGTSSVVGVCVGSGVDTGAGSCAGGRKLIFVVWDKIVLRLGNFILLYTFVVLSCRLRIGVMSSSESNPESESEPSSVLYSTGISLDASSSSGSGYVVSSGGRSGEGTDIGSGKSIDVGAGRSSGVSLSIVIPNLEI